ncbi:hypothetical protein Mal15_29090 [Stieleria maiorica]|uniref:Uncharacterized protein n=1 Tax=Stieleria maiorica TaxID=2795974 RepID=A0A5B9MCB3_9BACT|nr:hypothetical protein Mal15_29090 [Stieleria maiorica]
MRLRRVSERRRWTATDAYQLITEILGDFLYRLEAYRMMLVSSSSISSDTVIVLAFALKPRWATISCVNS